MEELKLVLMNLFVVFLTTFGSVGITALGLLLRKYLKGKARLIWVMAEREAEAHLTVLLRQAIDYSDEQARNMKKALREKNPHAKLESIDKLAIAADAAVTLLKNSSLPDIGRDRLKELIEQELGTMRR